jgi:hypothetical protein
LVNDAAQQRLISLEARNLIQFGVAKATIVATVVINTQITAQITTQDAILFVLFENSSRALG